MFQPWQVGLKHRLAGATCIRSKPCASVLYAPNEAARRGGQGKARADVAQLVEHHLAKVRVASSNLVVRSETILHPVEWPRGEATDCKSVYTGSNPVSTSGGWRSGSALP